MTWKSRVFGSIKYNSSLVKKSSVANDTGCSGRFFLKGYVYPQNSMLVVDTLKRSGTVAGPPINIAPINSSYRSQFSRLRMPQCIVKYALPLATNSYKAFNCSSGGVRNMELLMTKSNAARRSGCSTLKSSDTSTVAIP